MICRVFVVISTIYYNVELNSVQRHVSDMTKCTSQLLYRFSLWLLALWSIPLSYNILRWLEIKYEHVPQMINSLKQSENMKLWCYSILCPLKQGDTCLFLLMAGCYIPQPQWWNSSFQLILAFGSWVYLDWISHFRHTLVHIFDVPGNNVTLIDHFVLVAVNNDCV